MANKVLRIQKNIAFLAIALFILKAAAWWLTKSVAIFTDALESIVNVITGLIGLYSVWLAAKPRDRNHPYGHGKVEFISAAIEGTLITIAGFVVIAEAVRDLQHPKTLHHVNKGLILLGITAIINFAVGWYSQKNGQKERSAAVEAAGKHLMTDTYNTLGVIVGLILLQLTGWLWIDIAIALIMAIIIIYTGYRVLRSSLSGIMDEADLKLLTELVAYLNEHRPPQWIDLHNLRLIKYGQVLHLDGHLTLPWYYTVKEAHREIETLDRMVREKFGDAVELFVHVDSCQTFSCESCWLENCQHREKPFKQRIEWTLENVLENKKHRLE